MSIFGRDGSCAYYCRGMYSAGRELLEQTLDLVRRTLETCESPQGFMINHAACGGFGSGFASLLMERMSVDVDRKSVKMLNTLGPSNS